MKKITLLLAILCVNALMGMESFKSGSSQYMSTEVSPSEIKDYVISTIKLYNNIDTVIKALKEDGIAIPNSTAKLNDKFDHQKEFTALVHILANAFNKTSSVVAEKFGTLEEAVKYKALGERLLSAVKAGNIDTATLLIKEGADVNFIARGFFREGKTPTYHFEIEYDNTSPLTYAVIYGKAEMVKLLLSAGVEPESNAYYDFYGYYPADTPSAFGNTGTSEDREKIKQMIAQARKK